MMSTNGSVVPPAGAVSVIAGYDQAGVNIGALTVSSFVTLSAAPILLRNLCRVGS
jgi:hypothetical protein